MGGLGVAIQLALLSGEILHRLVIQERVDRPRRRAGVEVVHLLAQLVAPIGDQAGIGDVGHHHHGGRGHQFPSELDPEGHADSDQFQDRGRDVEQQEVEHHVDALGPALDDLGHRPGAPRQVKAQGQSVQMPEGMFRQRPGGVLSDPFEDHVAQIVEEGAAEPRGGIGHDQRHRDRGGSAGSTRHLVDRGGIGEPHQERHGLPDHDQDHGEHDPALHLGLAVGPHIGEEAAQRGERELGVGARSGCSHRRQCRGRAPPLPAGARSHEGELHQAATHGPLGWIGAGSDGPLGANRPAGRRVGAAQLEMSIANGGGRQDPDRGLRGRLRSRLGR